MMPWVTQYHSLEGFFLALIYLLSVCKYWRFFLDPIVAEVPLTFAWCTWLSSWCVEMVLHGMWRWFFFMVCGDGCILRTHRVLGKGEFYPWCEDDFIIMSWYTLDTRLEL